MMAYFDNRTNLLSMGNINQDSFSFVDAKWVPPPQDSFKVNFDTSIGSSEMCDVRKNLSEVLAAK